MSTQATGRFEVKSWDEKPYDEIEGAPKLSRAGVILLYEGDVEGQGTVEYLLAYRDDGSADFVSMERVVGRLAERAGSFVLQGSGSFEGGTARGTWRVVPGSGTGELRGLRGEGGFVATHGQKYSDIKLDYELD